MMRSDIESIMNHWLTSNYSDLPSDIEITLASKSLGFAISAAFDYKVTYLNHRFNSIAPEVDMETPARPQPTKLEIQTRS